MGLESYFETGDNEIVCPIERCQYSEKTHKEVGSSAKVRPHHLGEPWCDGSGATVTVR